MMHFGTQEQMLFAKRLSMILRSGMPIMEGLGMLGYGKHSRSASFIYQSLLADVSEGQPLSSSIDKFNRHFGAFSVNMIRVGEASGTLHENLEYLAEELKRKQALRRKVVGALIYPAVIIAATFGITILLTVYIFPKIVPIFQSVKAHLPLSTRILMATSAFLSKDGLWLLLVLVVFVVASLFALRIRHVRFWRDCFVLRLPFLGTLSKCYNLANLCRTLSLLLKSDVHILESIDLVAAGTYNLAYKRELLRARERIMHGEKISAQFMHDPLLFPALLAQMTAVGESTGNLASTLSYVSGMYEEEIDDLIKNVTTMLEPILMVIMGTVVGFIAISIITPIYSITENLTPR